MRLAGAGVRRHVEVDTSCFVANAPGWVVVSAAVTAADTTTLSWREVLPRAAVQPDTRHRFLIADPDAATHVRLDVIPDGGLARFRALGELTQGALDLMRERWQATRAGQPERNGC